MMRTCALWWSSRARGSGSRQPKAGVSEGCKIGSNCRAAVESVCCRGQAVFGRAAAVTSRHAISHMLTCPLCLPVSRADISIPGLMPGQIATPVRLGRARQGIFNPGVAELAGLDAERIVQVHNFCLLSCTPLTPITAAAGLWSCLSGLTVGASPCYGRSRVPALLLNS